MSEAKLLRALADKIEDLDAVKHYPEEIIDPGTLTVSWTAGNDHPGYQALSEAIGALVQQHWGALRSQVIKQRELEVQAARAVWTGVHQSGDDASSLSSPTTEVGFRKLAG